MRLQDKVQCSTKFRIVDYNPDWELISVKLDEDDSVAGPYFTTLPIQLSALGIYFDANNYCSPGDHLPVGHPDYFARKYIDRHTNLAVYEYEFDNGKYARMRPCNIQKDDDFQITGGYSLIDLGTKRVENRFAQKQNKSTVNNILADMMEVSLPGDMLEGTIIRILVRVMDQPNDEQVGLYSDVLYFDDTADAELYHPDDIIIVLHDEGTDAEYELPLSFVKKI